MGRLFRADSMDDLCAKLLESIQAKACTSTVDPSILEEIGIAKHAQRVLDVLAKKT